MKLIFVTDLHSNKLLYNSLAELIYKVEPDLLIIGGDLFAYSSSAEPQLIFAKNIFYEFIKKIKIPIYIIPGNCDKPFTVKYLNEMKDHGLLDFLTLSGTVINNIEFVGYSYTQPSPFKIKDWERRDLRNDKVIFKGPCLLSDKNDKLYLVPNDFLNKLPSIEEDLSILTHKKSVWVIHTPPFGGALDKNYANEYAGSKAVCKSIERVQPLLTLHGHIHESPYMSRRCSEKIGKTISINPGSGDLLHAVLIEIDESGVLSMSHTLYGSLMN